MAADSPGALDRFPDKTLEAVMVELDVVVIDTDNVEWHEATQWAGAFIAGFR